MRAMSHTPSPLEVRAQPPAIPVLPRFMATGPLEFRAAQYAPLPRAGGATVDPGVAECRAGRFVNKPTATIGIYIAFAAGAPQCCRQTCRVTPRAGAPAHKMLPRIFRKRSQRPSQPERIRQQSLPGVEERSAAPALDRLSALCKKTIARNCSMRFAHDRHSGARKSACHSMHRRNHPIRNSISFYRCIEPLWHPP
jgi:hypothetical protein